ncbi:nucleoside hydrolase [Leptolyngbya iicbica]|uniref:Nucleoside hydrolase n=2 Tax=Cyanophyceae TaxID=3028117 RepID=A0A4Q7E279_9CYAN|nr:nucleoside hydrolase [Leptolyngbya sp. LK]RZM76520.1 nucleoside hydrolase [Leptolyngbya sp. LK]
MAVKPIIIDCDPGVDDAIALMLALRSPELDVQGITVVAGNVPLALTQRNARQICELLNRRDVPIYAGCPRPLVRSLITAEDIHGKTGLEGATLPDPTLPLQTTHAVNYLIDTLSTTPAPLTIATLGPLTNLAVALIQKPEIAEGIERIVMMGGGITHGNITPVAEFNIYVDPHAAQVVFDSGIPITFISLDITHQVLTTPARLAAIQTLGNPVSEVAAAILGHYGKVDEQRLGTVGAPLHDPCVIAYLLRPDLFTTYRGYVQVELSSPLTLGQTVVSRDAREAPWVDIVDTVEAEGIYELLTKRLENSDSLSV